MFLTDRRLVTYIRKKKKFRLYSPPTAGGKNRKPRTGCGKRKTIECCLDCHLLATYINSTLVITVLKYFTPRVCLPACLNGASKSLQATLFISLSPQACNVCFLPVDGAPYTKIIFQPCKKAKSLENMYVPHRCGMLFFFLGSFPEHI